jgi:hypothetical protein
MLQPVKNGQEAPRLNPGPRGGSLRDGFAMRDKPPAATVDALESTAFDLTSFVQCSNDMLHVRCDERHFRRG